MKEHLNVVYFGPREAHSHFVGDRFRVFKEVEHQERMERSGMIFVRLCTRRVVNLLGTEYFVPDSEILEILRRCLGKYSHDYNSFSHLCSMGDWSHYCHSAKDIIPGILDAWAHRFEYRGYFCIKRLVSQLHRDECMLDLSVGKIGDCAKVIFVQDFGTDPHHLVVDHYTLDEKGQWLADAFKDIRHYFNDGEFPVCYLQVGDTVIGRLYRSLYY